MDHEAIGRSFGYPECCIQAFVADAAKGNVQSAKERGLIILGPGRQYVPCPACIGKLGYHTFEQALSRSISDYQKVAAIVCFDIDILADLAETATSLEDLKQSVAVVKEMKDEAIRDEKIRNIRYKAMGDIFFLEDKDESIRDS